MRSRGCTEILSAALLLWALPTWSVDTQLSQSLPVDQEANDSLSDDLIGQEQRHMISAWGSPVHQREDNLNETYDFGNMVILGNLPLPRKGRLLGWRAYFARTDVPVDFQIWRPEVGEEPAFLKLVAHTGPVFAEDEGTSIFMLDTLSIKDVYFNRSDLIGWHEEGCGMMEGKTEGFLLSCTSHRFRRTMDGCTTYSVQALVNWNPKAGHDTCTAVSGREMVAPPSNPAGSPNGGGYNYPPGSDYEMPVYTMPCKEVLMASKSDYGHIELLNFTHVPLAEDVCMLVILNLGDLQMTSQYALRADVIRMESKVVTNTDAQQCSPLHPLLELQDGPFMASHVVASLCRWDPNDHVITVCQRHLRIRISNRGKLSALRIHYSVVNKALTPCQSPTSPWFPRSGSRVSAIVAIIVISLLAVIIAFSVTKLAKRGAPLFRERVTSPDGSELFAHDDLMYRTSLSLSSPTSSWPGDTPQGHSGSSSLGNNYQGHYLLGDGAHLSQSNSDMTSLTTTTTTDRITADINVNNDPCNTADGAMIDDDLLSPLSLTSPRSLTSPISLTSVTSLATPTSGTIVGIAPPPSGGTDGRTPSVTGVLTVSRAQAHK